MNATGSPRRSRAVTTSPRERGGQARRLLRAERTVMALPRDSRSNAAARPGAQDSTRASRYGSTHWCSGGGLRTAFRRGLGNTRRRPLGSAPMPTRHRLCEVCIYRA